MSGRDVKRQVAEAARRCVAATTTDEQVDALEQALAALAPCLVLTREEATYVRNVVRFGSNCPPKRRYTETALTYLSASEVDNRAPLTPADEGEGGE